MFKSKFLQSLFEIVPLCHAKVNALCIFQLLDNMDKHKDTFYDDMKILIDATEGKEIRKCK